MSRFSTKKISTLALLTSAIFTVTSLAPIEFAPGPLSPDATFAKSENGKGGGKSGNKGGNGGGRGGDKSTAKGSKSGGRGGGKGLGRSVGKGVGGMLAKATKKGGNLINSVLGRGKAKTKAKKPAFAATETPKVKPKDMLAAMGYAPNEVKGWNGAFHASPNAALHASVNSIHGRAAAFFAQQMTADTAAADALVAADAANAALEAFVALNGDPTNVPTDIDYAAAQDTLADLAAAAVPDEAATAAAQAVIDQYEAYNSEGGVADLQAAAQALQETADMEQIEAESAFAAVTPNVEYTPQKADDFYSMMADNQAMVDRVAGIVEAEAAAAEAAAAEAPAVEENVVLLKTGDGETIALVVE